MCWGCGSLYIGLRAKITRHASQNWLISKLQNRLKMYFFAVFRSDNSCTWPSESIEDKKLYLKAQVGLISISPIWRNGYFTSKQVVTASPRFEVSRFEITFIKIAIISFKAFGGGVDHCILVKKQKLLRLQAKIGLSAKSKIDWKCLFSRFLRRKTDVHDQVNA